MLYDIVHRGMLQQSWSRKADESETKYINLITLAFYVPVSVSITENIMALPSESSNEDDAAKEIGKEITELRLAKKQLFEKARPINEELEKIAQRERECVDIEHHLRAEKHDREKQKQTVERLLSLIHISEPRD